MTELVNDTREPYTDTGPRDPADPSQPIPQFQPVTNNDPMGQFYTLTHQLSTGWAKGIDANPGETVNNLAYNVQKSVQSAAGAIRDGDRAAYHAARNLDIHPDGRMARSNQAITEAQAKADKHIEEAQVCLGVLTTILEKDAMPKMVKGEELSSRVDFQMALSGPGDLVGKLRSLAASDGSIGALATDPKFLKLAFMSHGVPEQDHDLLITTARNTAKEAAVKSTDPDRRAAVKLINAANRNLQGAITSAREMRHHVKVR